MENVQQKEERKFEQKMRKIMYTDVYNVEQLQTNYGTFASMRRMLTTKPRKILVLVCLPSTNMIAKLWVVHNFFF